MTDMEIGDYEWIDAMVDQWVWPDDMRQEMVDWSVKRAGELFEYWPIVVRKYVETKAYLVGAERACRHGT